MAGDDVYDMVRDRLASEDLAVAEGTAEGTKYIDLRRDGATILRVLLYDGEGGRYVNIAGTRDLGRSDDPGDVSGFVQVVRDGDRRDGDIRAMIRALGDEVLRSRDLPRRTASDAVFVNRLERAIRTPDVAIRRSEHLDNVRLTLRGGTGPGLAVVIMTDCRPFEVVILRPGEELPSRDDPDARRHVVADHEGHAFDALVAEVGRLGARGALPRPDADGKVDVATLVEWVVGRGGADGVSDLVDGIARSGHAEAVLEGLRELVERPAPGP